MNSTRLLVVDDDLSFGAQLERSLSALAPCVVAHAADTEGALALATGGQFDAVVVEPNLPGMTWVRFLRDLAGAVGGARLIIATWFSSAAMATEAIRLGVDEYFVKPTRPDEVAAVLAGGHRPTPPDLSPDEPTLDQCSWEYLNHVLRRCDGNISEAARRLGIPRQSIYFKLRKQPRPPVKTLVIHGVPSRR
jgi:two-component system, response regulator RegA